MREYILLYINGKRREIKGDQAFMSLARYLREIEGMVGTKIVCSEGDCGACTTLLYRPYLKEDRFFSINSCISPIYSLDSCVVVTIEGIKEGDDLHPVQKSMVEHHATQCGYCTPGMVCSMAAMVDDLKEKKEKATEQKIKNNLTGNLCRCTGYKSIIAAGLEVDLKSITPLEKRYLSKNVKDDLSKILNRPVRIKASDGEIVIPSSHKNLFEWKSKGAQIFSGGTDLGVLKNKGKLELKKLLSINNIQSLYRIKDYKKFVRIGAKVSLESTRVALKKPFPEFSSKLDIFASPQVKHTGTLVGNIANGSPIGDTLPFLLVSDATLEIEGGNGKREVPLNGFFKGYKKNDLKKDEIIMAVKIPKSTCSFKFYKTSNRKDLDISTVSMAIRYEVNERRIENFSLAIGGVAATAIRLKKIEAQVEGQEITSDLFKRVGGMLESEISPLSDLRSSAEYRMMVCKNLLMKFYSEEFS